jgi:hypothetical protein
MPDNKMEREQKTTYRSRSSQNPQMFSSGIKVKGLLKTITVI